MKIALIGYGKMGRVIEGIAIDRGHEVVLRSGRAGFATEALKKADIAIEFSNPESAFENIRKCLNSGIPVVCGTTGWLGRKAEIEDLCHSLNGSFLYASNFSLGVNLTFALNRYLVDLMAKHDEYTPSITEIHHTEKLDAPSGTAITLAEGIIGRRQKLKKWVLEDGKTSDPESLSIKAIRENSVPGTHIAHWKSAVDDIEIKHTAHNRNGFGLGAVLAAEYLVQHSGVHSMEDVLGLNPVETKKT